MNLEQKALAYLERDRLLFADMLEPLRRGSAELLYVQEDGVLLYEQVGALYLMTARNPAGVEACLRRIPSGALVSGHELWYKEEAAARLSFPEAQVCYQAAWLEREPPPEPEMVLRLLPVERAPWVYEHYSHPFGGVEYMEGVLRRGMLGAYVDGALAGFVGFHDEGSIGMLEVLPQFRRRGVGKALLHGAVRLALERGMLPFGQVFYGNDASLSLQKRAGLQVSGPELFWLM